MAKITDLGFCKPQGMISNTIVGTPMYMGPDIWDGEYDYKVDIYAFGILIWYILSNQTKLPRGYKEFKKTEDVWEFVKIGENMCNYYLLHCNKVTFSN